MRFLKGHGTENDFVLLPDEDAALELTAAQVAAVCDRRAGIGGDGVLRVVPTAAVAEVADQAAAARWFMDYRNADGSLAEMCGNGVRVFARYLRAAGLEGGDEFAVATRAGTRQVRLRADGTVSADMGRWSLPGPDRVEVSVGGATWPAVSVSMGNPHAVAFVDDLDAVGPLVAPPVVVPVFPHGVNVELVAVRGERQVAMRVHERGSGETRSCGTGAGAVAVAAALRFSGPDGPAADETWVVDVLGGRLTVELHPDRTVELAGPAVIVATGDIDETWLKEHA